METPDNQHPLYALSGCLYSEADIPKCVECKCEIHPRNESDDPGFCIDCYKINKS